MRFGACYSSMLRTPVLGEPKSWSNHLRYSDAQHFFQQKAMARASDVNFKQLLSGWDWTPRKVSTCWYWVDPGPDGSRRSDADFAFRACGWCLTGFMDVVSLWPTWPGKPGKDKWPIFHAYKYIIYIYTYLYIFISIYINIYLYIYISISIYIYI